MAKSAPKGLGPRSMYESVRVALASLLSRPRRKGRPAKPKAEKPAEEARK